MIRRPPRSTRTDPLVPYTTLFRSGFVLHSGEYRQDSTLQVDESVALTATVDILRDIAAGEGPRRKLLALGYAGWGPGQLDSEIQANGWLHVAPDEDLVFEDSLENKWECAIGKLGVDVSQRGRATVGHTGTNANLVCRLILETKQRKHS